MDYDDDHYFDYEEEEYIDRLLKDNVEEYIYQNWQSISEPAIRDFLAEHGDVVQERINVCLKSGGDLHSQGYYRESLVNSVTAIELIIRFMLLRPLVQGVFLSEEWAEILAKKVVAGKTVEDRELLPAVMRKWGVDITKVFISDGLNLWESVHRITRKRNDVVHEGDSASKEESCEAIDCANSLFAKILLPIASRLGFAIKDTGCWNKIKVDAGVKIYNKKSPFPNRKKSGSPPRTG